MTAISVVMGVHDGATTLAATLDSILAQSERDFELIVIDDGSSDATASILAAYAQRDGRVRVIAQENRGLTQSLIRGCAEARGAYIARQDAGDLSHPRRFEVQKRLLDAADDVVFVSSATEYVGPEGEPLWIAHPSGAALAPAMILLGNGLIDGPTHHGSVMFRRDAYERAGGYRAAFYYGQDFDLWFRLAAIGKFQTVDEVLYTARITADSISGLARAEQRRLARLSRAALDARLRGERDDAIVARAAAVRPRRRRRSRARLAAGVYFIGEALRRNGDRRARPYLRRAIAAWPFSPRAWIRYLQSLLL